MAAADAAHFSQRQYGSRQVAKNPERREPGGGAEAAGKQEIADAHKHVAHDRKCQNARSSEITDSANKCECDAGDTQQRHYRAAYDETRGSRSVAAFRINARGPGTHIRIAPHPARAIRFECAQSLNLIAPHTPGSIVENAGQAIDLIHDIKRFAIDDEERRFEIRRSTLFAAAIRYPNHLQQMLHRRSDDFLYQ